LAILLILGPSGAGKSCFGSWLASAQGWLHYEIDRHPDDGINLNGLRSEWDIFLRDTNAQPLAAILHQRLQSSSKSHAVLTFPSHLILRPGHLQAAAQAGMQAIYLYGSEANCIAAFLNREGQKGLTREHWMANNLGLYLEITKPEYDPYKIEVFTENGDRKPHAEVFATLHMT
jgi:gluconate kinase